MKKILATILVLTTVFSTQAQMGTPIPKELETIKYMTGKWEGTLKMSFMGQTSDSKASTVSRMGVGGRYLMGEHSYDAGGMTMYGAQMMTYDAAKKQWISWWFDSAESGAMEMTGNFDAKGVLVLISKPTPMEGMPEPIVMRASYKKVSDKHYDFTLDMKMGDKWETMMSGAYKKTADK